MVRECINSKSNYNCIGDQLAYVSRNVVCILPISRYNKYVEVIGLLSYSAMKKANGFIFEDTTNSHPKMNDQRLWNEFLCQF